MPLVATRDDSSGMPSAVRACATTSIGVSSPERQPHAASAASSSRRDREAAQQASQAEAPLRRDPIAPKRGGAPGLCRLEPAETDQALAQPRILARERRQPVSEQLPLPPGAARVARRDEFVAKQPGAHETRRGVRERIVREQPQHAAVALAAASTRSGASRDTRAGLAIAANQICQSSRGWNGDTTQGRRIGSPGLQGNS